MDIDHDLQDLEDLATGAYRAGKTDDQVRAILQAYVLHQKAKRAEVRVAQEREQVARQQAKDLVSEFLEDQA